MSTPFLGELKIVSFNFAPTGYAFCNGQILPISQNTALFSLLGTTYGGNGVNTFALPNLQGQTPIHVGLGFTQGQTGGEATHTLTVSEMPAHTHALSGAGATGTTGNPANEVLATAPLGLGNVYGPATQLTPMSSTAIGTVGGGQPHENRRPFLVLNIVIALEGIYPSRN